MDDNKPSSTHLGVLNVLKDIDVPAPDVNARKIALNLAMAEFNDAKKSFANQGLEKNIAENEKKSQGRGLLSRLTFISGQKAAQPKRRQTMNKTWKFGGMAAALATVAGVAFLSMPMLTKTSGIGSSYHSTIAKQDGLANADKVGRQITLERLEADQAEVAAIAAPHAKSAVEGKEESRKVAAPAMEMAEAELFAQSNTQPAPQGAARVQSVPSAPVMPGIAGGVAADAMSSEMIAIAPPVAMPVDVVTNEYKDVGRDKFEDFEENSVKSVMAEPVSTFSVDVDTTSYAFMRKNILSGHLPQKDAVRIEEMVNYFDYDYALPKDKAQPFQPSVTVTPSPWKEGNKLVHIGIKGYDIVDTPRSNLVFLLDTSGSMNAEDKLPLVKNAMKLLLDTLHDDDTVAIVTYAGSAGTALEPTKVKDKAKILESLNNLAAGGSTAGAQGIELAYQLAENNFDKDAVNRIMLATDGDFNVGITNSEELQDYVERKREKGIYLSVLGFGIGNFNDQIMQTLAQNGNGVAAYIDTLSEARKVLVEEATSSLFPIAKDVKIQVEFNPSTVSEYRLIGYETRALNREDFNNDKVDAGDIGSGHTVTAIYEITPKGEAGLIGDSRYANEAAPKTEEKGDEYAFLRIRYKLPTEDTSRLIETPITKDRADIPTQDVQWATAVTGFGQILKGGKYIGAFGYDDVLRLAEEGKGKDKFGYRAEFTQLVRLAKSANPMGEQ